MAGTSGIKRPLTDEVLDEIQAKVAKTTGN